MTGDTSLAFNDLQVAPLGAGDLIDRAVRLYRRHFFTLIRIAAPPWPKLCSARDLGAKLA